jgi:hypothetical protein
MLDCAGMIHEGGNSITGGGMPGIPGLGGNAQVAETKGRYRYLPETGLFDIFSHAQPEMDIQTGMNDNQDGEQ